MNETKSYPSFLSIAQAATLLQLSEQRVRKLTFENQIEGSKIGRVWVLNENSVLNFAQNRGIILSANMKRTSPKRDQSKMKVLSFFSGAMGLDIGLELAGFETIMACEYDKWSRATILANRPELPLLGDIWGCTADSVRQAAGIKPGEDVDVIAGGPPCQAFSTAGNRQGFEDARGNVFLQFIDLAMELKPKFLVLENVRGLLSAPLKHRPHNQRGIGFSELTEEEMPGGALKYIRAKIESFGYSVSFNLYNAANFGAPQTRERVILICSRDGKKVSYLSPTNSSTSSFILPPWKTFMDACGDLKDKQHDFVKFPENRLKYYRLLGPGQYWKHLPEPLQKEALGNSYYSGGGKTGFFRRLAWDKPSPTLVTHPAMPATDLCHPEENRPLSVQEYKRIQEFPDDWEIKGPLLQQYKQIGNAVPIPLGKAVGERLLAHSEGRILPIPDGFKFSRYLGTSEEDFQVSKTESLQLKLFSL